MNLFFSPSQLAFYEAGRTDVPDDAVPIAARRHRKLFEDIMKGGQLVVGPDGRPRIEWPGVEARRATLLNRLKGEAARRIELACPLWRQLNLVREGKAEEIAALVDPIRARSNALEAEVRKLKARQLDTFDPYDEAMWAALPKTSL